MLDFSFSEFYSFITSMVSMFLCYRVRGLTNQHEALNKRIEELQQELELARRNAE